MSKSKMEQLFDYVKLHPGITGEVVQKALPHIGGSCSSLLSQMENRKILKSEKIEVKGKKGRFSRRLIRHYTIAQEHYSLNRPAEKAPEPKQVPPPPAENRPATLEEATPLQLIEQLLKLQRTMIRQELETIISEKIVNAFAETGPPELPQEPLEKGIKRVALRRYFIVGLLPEQAFIVAKRLEGLCELRFWKDEDTSKLRAHAAWSDVTFIMTKFISHSTQDIIRKTGERMLQCNGGVTDLLFQLQNDLAGLT